MSHPARILPDPLDLDEIPLTEVGPELRRLRAENADLLARLATAERDYHTMREACARRDAEWDARETRLARIEGQRAELLSFARTVVSDYWERPDWRVHRAFHWIADALEPEFAENGIEKVDTLRDLLTVECDRCDGRGTRSYDEDRFSEGVGHYQVSEDGECNECDGRGRVAREA